MKVEIGESLLYSYLRHVENCVLTQLNWKPSSHWPIPDRLTDDLRFRFEQMQKHHAFADVFKSKFEQTLRQGEIDVLGITGSTVFAVDVAFHEAGLQYGTKIETRNRVVKKLLRSSLALAAYFPEHQHRILFCAPKVNRATDEVIKDYFEVLLADFSSEGLKFEYCANEDFQERILTPTLDATKSEADTSELFCRSVKLLSMFPDPQSASPKAEMDPRVESRPELRTSRDRKEHSVREVQVKPHLGASTIEIAGHILPTRKREDELFQDFVRELFTELFNHSLIPEREIQRLRDKEYSKHSFGLQFPLLIEKNENPLDNAGHSRYWKTYIFGGKYRICSEWWKTNEPEYAEKTCSWLAHLKRIAELDQ